MRKEWVFRVQTEFQSLPELYVRIDKEPEESDGEQSLTTTYSLGYNDSEENEVFHKIYCCMFLTDWHLDGSQVGTGVLQCKEKQWKLSNITPQKYIGPHIEECSINESRKANVEISITWKFQRAELIKEIRVP